MTTNFYDNKYMISVVEPIKNGRRESLRVDVYEILDPVLSNLTPDSSVKHVRFVTSFPLYDRFGDNQLSLDEIVAKVNEIAIIDINSPANVK
ncbi:MAG: hypothetical protein AABX54_00630 [Nanoarchaeota archaeon]